MRLQFLNGGSVGRAFDIGLHAYMYLCFSSRIKKTWKLDSYVCETRRAENLRQLLYNVGHGTGISMRKLENLRQLLYNVGYGTGISMSKLEKTI